MTNVNEEVNIKLGYTIIEKINQLNYRRQLFIPIKAKQPTDIHLLVIIGWVAVGINVFLSLIRTCVHVGKKCYQRTCKCQTWTLTKDAVDTLVKSQPSMECQMLNTRKDG